MLHVFFVNEGRMLNLDVAASGVSTVHHLQNVVCDHTRVPPQDQVLLKSGGETLDASRHVAFYEGAWTESTPLFMLCKLPPHSQHQPALCADDIAHIDDSLNDLVNDLAVLNNDVSTSRSVVDRYAEEARQAVQLAAIAVATCARLVQQHHLLHQGWLALVSNLDDSLVRFEKRVDRFRVMQQRLQSMRTRAGEMLSDFQAVLEGLAKIAVPPALSKTASLTTSESAAVACSSLLEWISASDPHYSLTDLADDVQAHLGKISEQEVDTLTHNLAAITELGKKSGERDVKGINMRFSQLDQNFRVVEGCDQSVKDAAQKVIEQQAKRVPETALRDTIRLQRDLTATIVDSVNVLRQRLGLFAKSKSEILTIIRARLSGGWIVQVYEHMHKANNALVLFEEKVVGLRRRLDLIRQLRDAPTVYAASIAEVLRRGAFHQELTLWAHGLLERWTALARDETAIRDEFASKIDRHFLRALFAGMGDRFPGDWLGNPLPEFDLHLPPVEMQHLRDLRQTVPHLAGLLKVSEPQIHHRLHVEGGGLPRAHPTSLGFRGRDDSVFTADSPNPFGTLDRTRFPSTNWLSGDENLDISSPTCGDALLLMGRTPPSSRFASMSSLDPSRGLNPLSPLDQDGGPSTIVAKCASSTPIATAPIQIPSGASGGRQAVSFYTDVENVEGDGHRRRHSFSSPPDVVQRENERSSGGNTTSGDYQEQFAMDKRGSHADVSQFEEERERLNAELNELKTKLQSRDEMMRKLRPFVDELEGIRKGLSEVRRCVAEDWRQRAAEVEAHSSLVARSAIALESHLQRDVALAQNAATQLLVEQHELELQRMRALIQLEKQRGHLDALVDQKDDVIRLLEERIVEAEEAAKTKCEAIQAETFKNLTIEYELQMDAMRDDHMRTIKLKEQEMADVRKQLVEKQATIERQKAEMETLIATYSTSRSMIVETAQCHSPSSASPDSPGSDLRSEMEKEFKIKMQLLTKGLEERHAEALARCRKEAEFDARMTLAKHKERIADLETQLADARRDDGGRRETSGDTMAVSMISRDSPVPPAPPSGLSMSMAASMMLESAFVLDSASTHESASTPSNDDACSDITLRALMNTASTQTRIRLKEMRLMIAIQDIHEECAVLVIWDDVHNSYVLFSTSPTMYFVKESSIREMGMLTTSTATAASASTAIASTIASGTRGASARRNWMLATTVKLEYCQIKRIDNRYRLPMDTRFYRVDVEPLPLDSSAFLRRHRSSTSPAAAP